MLTYVIVAALCGASGAPKKGQAAAADTAQAEESEGRIGVAAETLLGSTSLGGTSIGFVYEDGDLAVEGLVRLGMVIGPNPATWRVGAGVRVWYAMHRGDRADLAMGAGAAATMFQNIANTVQGGTYLEGGVRLRYFPTESFAVWTTLVLGVDLIFGQVAPGAPTVTATINTLAGAYGGFGATYYF